MQNLLYNISQVLGITIVHSLWQGLIIFIVLRLFMLVFPARSALLKYWVAYAALTFMLGWFVVTLFKELNLYNWLSTTALKVSPLALPDSMRQVSAPANKLYFTISAYMPYLTVIYVVGVVFNTLRLTFAWNNIYRIRQNITDAGFAQTVKRLSGTLNLTKKAQAAFSEWVDVPCVTGFIKPIILLPVALTTHLTTEEIEAVLLHELAHVKRNDYLLNFIQQVIGILLFFNPFARLVSKLINEERENCCDDVVVRATGSPFIYAKALLKLEENKHHQWQLALAATTKKYELLNRIERIMKTKTHTVNIRPVLITVLALTCSISSIAWLNPEIKDGKVVIKNAPAIRMVTAAITGSTAEIPPMPELKPVKHRKHLSFKPASDNAQDALLLDTTKKKYKIVIEDDNGAKKEYNSVNDMPAEDRENFLGKNNDFQMSMADAAQAAEFKKFYGSPEWKKQMAEMKKQSELIAKQFNNPEWKKKQRKMIEHSMAVAKPFMSPDYTKRILAMVKPFTSPEFIAKVQERALKGEDVDTEMDKYFESDEWKKQIADVEKSGEEMGKYYDSPEFKKQIEDMAKAGADMGKTFDSPEFKKQIESLAKSGAAMGKMFGDTIPGKRLKAPRPPKAMAKPPLSKKSRLLPPPRPAKPADKDAQDVKPL